MRNKLTSIVALTAALTPGVGNAIGFGEITLQSRIGEALRAEVPILASAEEPLTACFSLVPIRSSDLPVITAAKTRLIRRGQGYVLQVFGTRPVSEPIFAIAMQAGCGYDVVRQYILMPEAPFMSAEAYTAPSTTAITTGKPGKFKEWHAHEGETLEDIVDAQIPNSLAERQRLIAALKRANPHLPPETPLDEGTVVRIPTRKQGDAERKEASGRTVAQASTNAYPPAQRTKTKPSIAPPSQDTDRLLLGAAPEERKPREKTRSEPKSLAETEERLLKLEATLHLLTQEIEKMDQALDLATKAIEAQSQLQLAQALPLTQPPSATTTSLPTAPTVTSSKDIWLELLLSASLGAAISIGLAQYLGRQRRYPGEEETPLAFAGRNHDKVHPAKLETAEPFDIADLDASPSKAPPSNQSLPPPEHTFHKTTGSEIVDITMEDEYSVLDLAEIMLSYGRVHGAAQTLAEYIEENLPKSIRPWSMLLDLYRRGGMRQEFDTLAEQIRSRFNASIPAWIESSTPISGLKTLEDYTHVIQKATSRWGTQACLDYLLSLVHDTRAGQRNGFPLEVVEEIALLMRILEEAYELKRPV